MFKEELVLQEEDMTVADLITALSHFNPDTKLVIPGYEGGFTPIHGLKVFPLLTNVNDEWYYGPHDHLESVSNPQEYTQEDFLLLLK